jgi:hypothetical protein
MLLRNKRKFTHDSVDRVERVSARAIDMLQKQYLPSAEVSVNAAANRILI